MLRITTESEPLKITLKLEGDLTGVFVTELFDAWREAIPALGQRALCIDLSAVYRVDKAGEYLLALVRSTASTQLLGSGIFSRDLIRNIARDWPCANETALQEA